ncbi:MAG: flagellar basal body-associated FliL family protein [Fibrobacterales bacterium]
MADEDNEVAGAAEPIEEKKKSNLVMIILIMFLNMAFMVGISVVVINVLQLGPAPDLVAEQMAQQEDEERAAKEKSTQAGARLESSIAVTVNIAGTDGTRYLKTAVQVEFDMAQYPMVPAAIDERMPRIKDRIITILSEIPLVELTSKEGKQKIRNEITNDINLMLPEAAGQIRSCYFDEFVIQ